MPFFKGDVKESPRKQFLYWSDDGDLFAIRLNDWKISFNEQYHTGVGVWQNDYTKLRLPMLYNLRSDPFERGPESIFYDDWMVKRSFLYVPAQAARSPVAPSFKEYPIRAKPASFNLDEVMHKAQSEGLTTLAI